MPSWIRGAALIAAAVFAPLLSAQTTLAHADKAFIEKAAKSGAEEIAISQVVLERTVNPEVKALAQAVVDDHTRANQTLASIAASKGVMLPAKETGAAAKWSKKSGDDLDKDYVDKMVSAHKEAVKLFQKQAEKGQDAEARGFARETLIPLQRHLELAMDIKKAPR